ncbi:Coenzyme PQQ synthesis protein B [Emticicia aquatica]|uniref:Coenzyme PQQ synthesis protein B n=1 Tax=Emticicia aquatica TaxID=1681835 RepID=A0ABN8F1Y0_9BACT|nr:MBL fold metallo-hydrolase [Emticicia aquatica]CAH0997263.1 Coenzyme PQQ synthesis protein B [Emticicia aquatica]
MKKTLFFAFLLAYSYSFAQNPYVMVLGVAQDGGFPQANCQKECCKAVFEGKTAKQFVSCIAVIDPISKEKWIFDATPDFTQQLHLLNQKPYENSKIGIFLTHAHIGHYTGLMYLGREAIGANKIKVFTMPKMKSFLEKNGPWSQLVALQNIDLQAIKEDSTIILNERISVQAFRVPHRDEFSETVGYKIISPNKSLIFIPDIDKWQKWNRSLEEMIKSTDYAFLDGTFYADGEINRPMSEVPHPFVNETINLLKNIPQNQKAKVHFIHFNHTNPVMNPQSIEQKEVKKKGFKIAFQGQKVSL